MRTAKECSYWNAAAALSLFSIWSFWLILAFSKSSLSYEWLFALATCEFGFFWIVEKMRFRKSKGGVRPSFLYLTADLFPFALLALAIRTTIEPFGVSSDSMYPTLGAGDSILTWKAAYDWDSDPQRGDVVVFRRSEGGFGAIYVKRVVAIGGDVVEYDYADKALIVNGKKLKKEEVGTLSRNGRVFDKSFETEDGRSHLIATNPGRSRIPNPKMISFDKSSLCEYGLESMKCEVPKGESFVMGDDRDDSFDSRYWGFVRNSAIIGKAFAVVFSKNSDRLGELR